MTTTKGLLVRLQAPRFLIEGDEAVLSANVHNQLAAAKEVMAELQVPKDLFQPRGDAPPEDAAGNLLLKAKATVKPGETHRFDWPVRALKAGTAIVTVKALTDEESDAVRLTVPIMARGIIRDVSANGSFRQGEEGTKTATLTLPNDIDPLQTRLEISVSPGPLVAMLDSLPYLIDYPYGCTEQTMSRFYPAVVAADTLKKLGIDAAAIGQRQRPDSRASRFDYRRSPVFDAAKLRQITDSGLERLYRLQHRHEGWGWWPDDATSPYMTAYVLMGLHTARQAGLPVRAAAFEDGIDYLYRLLDAQEKAKAKENQNDEALHVRVYIAYVLAVATPTQWESRTGLNKESAAIAGKRKKLLDGLWAERARLTPLGQALLALAMQHDHEPAKAKTLLQGLLGQVEFAADKDTARVRTSRDEWWRWRHSDNETSAWVLRALLAIDPENPVAGQLASPSRRTEVMPSLAAMTERCGCGDCRSKSRTEESNRNAEVTQLRHDVWWGSAAAPHRGGVGGGATWPVIAR